MLQAGHAVATIKSCASAKRHKLSRVLFDTLERILAWCISQGLQYVHVLQHVGTAVAPDVFDTPVHACT